MTATTPAVEYDFTVDQHGAHLTWQGETFELEAADLIDGGWHRADEDCDPCERSHVEDLPGDPTEVLKRWHDESSGHGGAFAYCDAEPCKSVRDELEAWA